MKAVLASGIRSMSLSWIAAQPRMLDPSMPKPSSNLSRSNSPIGYETWCCRLGISVNLRSSCLASLVFANSKTSCGLIIPPGGDFSGIAAAADCEQDNECARAGSSRSQPRLFLPAAHEGVNGLQPTPKLRQQFETQGIRPVRQRLLGPVVDFH